MWVLFSVFVYSVCLSSEVFGGLANWRHSRRLLALPISNDISLPRDEWFVQKLDHSDPADGETWWQRYQTNATWFKNSRNSPVFLMIGGEGAASAEWMVMGAWMDYAKKYNALCFQLEHRFYGASQPKDLSVGGLHQLNSEQALADVAYFIAAINKKYKLTSTNKWIVFGGSYSGSLAAWARLKYPHLIHAAVSSSAPILAMADFEGYDEVVRQALSFSSAACAQNVEKAARIVQTRLKTSNDVEGLAKQFNRCSLNVTDPFEVAFFVDTLADNFRGAVQYSHDNRKPLNPVVLSTVDQLCEIMTNETLALIDRYAAVDQFVSFGDPNYCQDDTYRDFIQELRGVSDARSWFYQTCTEFGFYQTSSNENSLFGSLLNVELYVETCKRVFGSDFNFDRMAKGISRTNIMYGGLDIEVSRVAFVQGSLDPWHVLGLTKSSKADITVIFINGTAHCANMYPPSQDDPVQLISARKEVELVIGKWLSV